VHERETLPRADDVRAGQRGDRLVELLRCQRHHPHQIVLPWALTENRDRPGDRPGLVPKRCQSRLHCGTDRLRPNLPHPLERFSVGSDVLGRQRATKLDDQ
jgi:hypothetical protein